MSDTKKLTLNINGGRREAEVAANRTLLETLRGLGCVEVKSGCEKGDCGACAVLVDGTAVDSCLTLTWMVEGLEITTVAGLGTPDDPHPLVTEFIERGAVQCGYCTPGLIIAAECALGYTPTPSEEDIRFALSGNLCRCTGYTKVFDAVAAAAKAMGAERGEA